MKNDVIILGCVDAEVSEAQCSAYLERLNALTRRPVAQIQAGSGRVQIKRLPAPAAETMRVKDVQQALKDLLSVSALGMGMSLASGIVKLAGQLDQLMAEKEGVQGPLSGRTPSAQMSLGLNGAFRPTILPLFHGS